MPIAAGHRQHEAGAAAEKGRKGQKKAGGRGIGAAGLCPFPPFSSFSSFSFSPFSNLLPIWAMLLSLAESVNTQLASVRLPACQSEKARGWPGRGLGTTSACQRPPPGLSRSPAPSVCLSLVLTALAWPEHVPRYCQASPHSRAPLRLPPGQPTLQSANQPTSHCKHIPTNACPLPEEQVDMA